MARRNTRIWAATIDEGINLTPLLDVLFNLFFFFVFATTIKHKEAVLNLTLPPAEQPAVAAQPAEALSIAITADQVIFFNDRRVDEDALLSELRKIKPDEISGIVVRGDAKAYHETVVKVLDACARAGQTKLKIEVAPLPKPEPPGERK